jgi:sporulation protein YlmC with PRC-barrel domain
MNRPAIDASGSEAGIASTQFTIGVEVRCPDGACGSMSRVVIDPISRVVTHLVVDAKHPRGSSRLVPLSLVEGASGEIKLTCTMAEFGELEAAKETEFLPATRDHGGYGPGEALYWPHYGLAMGGLNGMGSLGMGAWLGDSRGVEDTYDALPPGEVAVRRGERVRATDGEIGRVEGLVIDTATHYVTHVLLQEGHLWGRKDVAIPIRAVTRVGDAIELNMAKRELAELPTVEIHHPEAIGTET